ncbi:MAG: hypothetical protein HKO63_06765 [Acidimicrobiia bacterium]|nr:hypothetical protein [Acidimicrobiia bacterium]NNL12976.1 hypothetical protein [Acidimicrobiia bacterium]NNL97889.1 hypothetical protein [Acidimicrobiia bacterium]
MRKLGRLFVVLAMVLATTGTTAASAGKPVVPDPVITLNAPTATCVQTGSGYDLVLQVPESSIVGGELSSFNVDTSRMADMTTESYTQTIRHESWYFGWWEGSDATELPRFPYVLNTADSYDPSDPTVVPSWTGHSLTGTLDAATTITDTGYFEVGLWVGAVATARGKGNAPRAHAGDSWVLQCIVPGAASLVELPNLIWCDEDESGWWSWDEGPNDRKECELLP